MLNDSEAVMIERDAAHLIHPLHSPAMHAGGKVWVGGEREFLIDANGGRCIDGLAEAAYKQMQEMAFASGYIGS